jgi:hypothetical protein
VAALVCSPAWPHPTSQVTIYGWTTREIDLKLLEELTNVRVLTRSIVRETVND